MAVFFAYVAIAIIGIPCALLAGVNLFIWRVVPCPWHTPYTPETWAGR